MPNYITDVAISELSLIYGEHQGKAWRPINPEANVLATKGQALPRTTLLGEFASQLLQKASGEDAAAEAKMQVAYTTILNTLYAATDDLYDIKWAPESFTTDAKKAALKTVVDNFVKAIQDVVPVVLKAQVDNRETSVAKPPFQAPPGDDPARVSNPPQGIPIAEPVTVSDPTPAQVPPAQVAQTEGEPIVDESLKAQLAEISTTLDSQKAEIDTFKAKVETLTAELDRSKAETVAAKDQLAGLVSAAQAPTLNATASRQVQEKAKKTDEEILAEAGVTVASLPGNGNLEKGIGALLAAGNPLK